MSSTNNERGDNIIWEHADSLSNDYICPPVFSKQANTPSSSQITTPGLNFPVATITLSSQDITVFFLHQAVANRESEAVVPLERVSGIVSFTRSFLWYSTFANSPTTVPIYPTTTWIHFQAFDTLSLSEAERNIQESCYHLHKKFYNNWNAEPWRWNAGRSHHKPHLLQINNHLALHSSEYLHVMNVTGGSIKAVLSCRRIRTWVQLTLSVTTVPPTFCIQFQFLIYSSEDIHSVTNQGISL